MRCLLILVFGLSVSLFAARHPEAVKISKDPSCAKNRVFLCSFPRSGQHWMKNLLQIIGNRPIYPLCGMYALENPLKLKIDHQKAPCYVMHSARWIDTAPTDTNKLIVIVRNYKECFARQVKACGKTPNLETMLKLKCTGFHYPELYLNVLALYDRWTPENRFFIYYEDLMTTPETVLSKLGDFLGDSQDGVTHLIENFQHYKNLSIRHYNQRERKAGGSMSKGKSTGFHSQNLSNQELDALDQIMQQKGGRLWEAYLMRYKEK